MVPRRKSRADRRRHKTDTPFSERRSRVARDIGMNFAVQRTRLLVSFSNELVAANCFGARDAILRALDAAGVEQVVINFETVPFVDSTAIGMLLELQKHLTAKKKYLVLANIPRQMQSLLDTLMLHGIFDIRTT